MVPGEQIGLQSEVADSVTIEQQGERQWRVTQRFFGDEHDNNHNVTWLRVQNRGPETTVRIEVIWAEFRHMADRRFGHLKHGDDWSTVQGETTPTSTVYEFTARAGDSLFGTFPWYGIEEERRFIEAICARSTLYSVRSIGRTAEGRPINCLCIGDEDKPNVVVLARMHAAESAGSWAVEGCAEYLLSDEARPLLEQYRFHLFISVNPDGVANGIKLTRMGPVDEYDMVRGGMTSADPTIVALREELFSLQPACLISHHSYLWSVPFLGIFERQVGLDMLDRLVKDDDLGNTGAWLVRFTGAERGFLRWECYDRFGTTVAFTELPWHHRLPDTIKRQGVDILRATLSAHECKARAREGETYAR